MGHKASNPISNQELANSDFVVIQQEQPRSEEITVQVPVLQFLNVLTILNTFNADLVATSEFITTDNLVHIWTHDSGNRIRNAIAAGLLGNDVIVLDKPIKRGTQKIVLKMSAFNLKQSIDLSLKSKFKLIAHTPVSHGGVHCVFF
jgi:hypothetical protein